MKNSVLVTITGLAHYYGTKPFKVGAVIKLKKEYDNKYDDEAIRAQLPYIGTVGYVANSTYTVYSGTYSAGRLYDKIGECACAKIILITHSSAVADPGFEPGQNESESLVLPLHKSATITDK